MTQTNNPININNEKTQQQFADIDRRIASTKAKAENILSPLQKWSSSLNNTLENRLSKSLDGLIRKGRSLEDVLSSARSELTQTALRLGVINPLQQALAGFSGAVFSGNNKNTASPAQSGLDRFLSGLLGNFFGGMRAAGGPVGTGRAYMVGERGPELFVPSAAGRIVPHGASGNAAAQITINIQTPNPQSFAQSQGQIAAALLDAVRRGQRTR